MTRQLEYAQNPRKSENLQKRETILIRFHFCLATVDQSYRVENLCIEIVQIVEKQSEPEGNYRDEVYYVGEAF